jgi:intergrase/recombinase
VELLNRVLTNYGDAYQVGFDMTNMSMMKGNNSNGMNTMSPMEMENDSSSMSMANASTTEASELVNITSYQTAQVLAAKVQKQFNSQLINASDDIRSLDNIATALRELVSTIDSKGTPMDVMSIVHTKIHPNFITAFGLQLG